MLGGRIRTKRTQAEGLPVLPIDDDACRVRLAGDASDQAQANGGERLVILIGASNRLLEDRRVRGDPADAVGVDQALELALCDEASGEKVEPDCLAVLLKVF